jgi:Rrf2 family protein
VHQLPELTLTSESAVTASWKILFDVLNCYQYSNIMASTNIQFSIAVHMMTGLAASPGHTCTSTELAGSVNTSASFVRRVLAKLSRSNLVRTAKGKSGFCALAKSPDSISLLEIFQAVEGPGPFAIHDYPVQRSCTVSCGIKSSLGTVLSRTTRAVQKSLSQITVADLLNDIKKKR